MRYIKNLIFSIVMTLFASQTVSSQLPFSGGKGTASEPFLISSVQDMEVLADSVNTNNRSYVASSAASHNWSFGKYFLLTGDITEPIHTVISTSDFNFEGVFDGGGHTLTLAIDSLGRSYIGVFGCTYYATIKNLCVQGYVRGGYCTGGIAGNINEGSIIENTINACTITGGSLMVGGIVGGMAVNCKLEQSANYGDVSGGSAVGGIVGYSNGINNIKRVANYGSVAGTGSYIGGVVGNPLHYEKMSYMINAGTKGISDVGGCLGVSRGDDPTELFYDQQYLNPKYSNPSQEKLTRELTGTALKTAETGEGFTTEYWIFSESLYPRLKINGHEDSALSILYATPVQLQDHDKLENLSTSFEVVTLNGVTWKSRTGKIRLQDGKGYGMELGKDTLTSHLDGYERLFPVVITGLSIPSGINQHQNNSIKISCPGLVKSGESFTFAIQRETPVTENVSLEIYTAYGMLAKLINATSTPALIDGITGNGIYIIKATCGDGQTFTRKIVVKD